MTRVAWILSLLAIVGVGVPIHAQAQRMFIDANGDGACGSADFLALSGPTTVSVWLQSDANGDGSPAYCMSEAAPLSIGSYVVNLKVDSGRLEFRDFINEQPTLDVAIQPFTASLTEMTVGFARIGYLDPGLHKLFTVTVTPVSGYPALSIVSLGTLQTTQPTSFGSICSGEDFDGTLKLGVEWSDVCGTRGGDFYQGMAPVITAPTLVTGAPNAELTVVGSAADPDAFRVVLSQSNDAPFLPSATSSELVEYPSITMRGTPSVEGTYTISWVAEDEWYYPNNRGSARTSVAIVRSNRCPAADAGGPYASIQGDPVELDGAGSADPDGDPLNFLWDFGDATTGVGARPVHTYRLAGVYGVTLWVDDGACQATAATLATVASEFPAAVFTTAAHRTTNLASGKPFTYVQVEPLDGSFATGDVDLSTVRMISPGTGSVREIFAVPGKPAANEDKNGNGMMELRVAFAKEDLRRLFSALPTSTTEVSVTIKGDVITGGRFHGSLEHQVKSSGGPLAASVSPNPLNPSARLTFTTTKAGALRVRLFDLNGRLIRTYLDEARATASDYDLAIDGRNETGQRLPSGVYFLSIQAEHDGVESKRVTILK